jgi:hypothetical protein
MEELDIQTLLTLKKECSERIKVAQRELDQCTILIEAFTEEIKIRKKSEE